MSTEDPELAVHNIQFVKLVEKYPCIYDYSRQDYGKREVTEKAWSEIACEIKQSVAYCKEKWKNMRTAFSRSIKKPPSGSGVNKKRKEYYLKGVMQFVLPYMKAKPQIGTLPCSVCKEENDSNNSADCQLDFNHAEDYCQIQHASSSVENSKKKPYDSSSSPEPQSANSSDIIEPDGNEIPNSVAKKSKILKNLENEADKCFVEYDDVYYKNTSMPHRTSNPDQADLEFLKSLLPDISKMTDYQKRQFKKRTLDTIDSILCDAPPQKRTH